MEDRKTNVSALAKKKGLLAIFLCIIIFLICMWKVAQVNMLVAAACTIAIVAVLFLFFYNYKKGITENVSTPVGLILPGKLREVSKTIATLFFSVWMSLKLTEMEFIFSNVLSLGGYFCMILYLISRGADHDERIEKMRLIAFRRSFITVMILGALIAALHTFNITISVNIDLTVMMIFIIYTFYGNAYSLQKHL